MRFAPLCASPPLIALSFIAAAMVLPGSSSLNGSAKAQVQEDFQSYLKRLGDQAVQQGVSQRTVDVVLPTLNYNQRVVNLDRAQPGGPVNSPIPKFAPYKARHVDAARIGEGRVKYQELRRLLSKVEQETGVPESIMVAIWGHETNYGKVRGNFDLPESLATLAYEGRRRELFSTEFIATLKMIDRGYSRERIKGSWAGATGHPQFLPTVYLKVARDGDGDGRADIWGSEADALASIANYFVRAGWRPGQSWGMAVSVPNGLDRAAIVNRTKSPRCPRVHDRHSQWKSVAEWKALGIRPIESDRLRNSDMATLLEPDGPGSTAYLLTGNYRVILDYNCSNFYALSVGLLADAVER